MTTGNPVPHLSWIDWMMASGKRMWFSKGPAEPVGPVVEVRAHELEMRYPWAACSSTASNPACLTRQAASSNSSTISMTSSVVRTWTVLRFSSAFA